MKQVLTKMSIFAAAAAFMLAVSASAFAQASIVIQNADTGTNGFNDPTAAAPVGGNSGTTVGQQRLNAFQAAANIWGATLTSSQTITIRASWADLPCTATSGTLGSAGATGSSANFSGALVQNRWYPVALANALSNADRNGASPEINAQFNQKLGQTGCLENLHWYYGLDNNHGSNGVDLVSVLLHEFGHGLGFANPTSSSTGAFLGTAPNNFPSIWDDYLFDDTAGKTWAQMATDAERQASAINTGKLVWIGPQAVADVPRGVLSGTPTVRVNSPSGIAGKYQALTADFGPQLSASGLTSNIVQALDAADGAGPSSTDGCSSFTNVTAVAGKIAFIDRGTCSFVAKTLNAQNAGAVGVIIADNAQNNLGGLGGGPNTSIVIPAVGISTADGNTLRSQLASGMNGTLLADLSRLAGTDAQGRPLMYTPSTLASGSSVSHWDTSLTPNQLMEPNISSDLFHAVSAPQDLTLSLLKDIGWRRNATEAPLIAIEQGTTNTASALDSVTFVKGPFSLTDNLNFTGDRRTRIILFTSDLGFNTAQSNPTTVSAQIGGIPATVESAGPFNALAGTSYILVRLPDGLSPGQTYVVTLTLSGTPSANAPTITIQ